MTRARRAQAGLTMVEVIVAAIILTAIVGMSAYLVWSSSRSVSSAEAGLQLENTAREALNVMVTELRQARRLQIVKVTTAPIRTDPQFGNVHTYPVTDPKLGIAVSPAPEGVDFDGIRFQLVDPRNTFNLDSFKNSTERTYIVQYWWQVEYDDQKEPKGGGNGPNGREPDLIDNNKNGVVDEGCLMKMETWFAPDGVTIDPNLGRQITTVLRNVKRLRFRLPAATTAADVLAGKPNLNSNRIEIAIDLEIMDPKKNVQLVDDKAGKEAILIMKSVSAVVDFRN
jgi:type II secretory pathway pseudopilin PulG